MIKQIIIGLPLRSHRIFLIICIITDRIGLHSVLLPLLRPLIFGNAQKGACKLFGTLSRTQYMPKKVHHMAYYASSLCSSDCFPFKCCHQIQGNMGNFRYAIQRQKKEPYLHIKIPFVISNIKFLVDYAIRCDLRLC